MIIRCEKCGTKFNLKESLLKKNGSRVRCSVCKHIFLAYPPILAKTGGDEVKTISLDSPPALDDVTVSIDRRDEEIDFDELFDKPVEEGAESDEDFFPSGLEREAGPGTEGIALPAKKMAGKSHVVPVFLVIILILLGSAAAVYFFAPDLIPDSLPFLKKEKKQIMMDSGVSRLTLKAVTGAFVSSKEAGQLFVIRGMVGNNYPKRRSFILIKGNILDNKGRLVKSKSAYAGNTFKDEKIKVLPLQEINKALKNRSGMDRKNFNIPQGTYIPFMIVFENLPENLSEFTVEAVSSFPGKS
jgi:predicted Zn finger-like uncharacterized protein